MAIDFLGTDEYADCGSGATLDDIVSLTVAAWIRWDTLDRTCTLVHKGDSTRRMLYVLGTANGGTGNSLYLLEDFDGASDGAWRSAVGSLSQGAWTHCAITYVNSSSGNDPIFYVGGVVSATTEVFSPAGTRLTDAANALRIGDVLPTTNYFDGQMEDVRVFNRILAAQEVAVLAGGYRGPLGGEVLWLPMSEVDGATLSSAAAVVFDMSGNGNHGTPQGGCLGQASYAPRMNGWIP